MSKAGVEDIRKSICDIKLPLFLAYSDIRQRYRRSSLGPFWITISTGVMIVCIGIIFGNIYDSGVKEFIPYLAAGMIIWGFISSTINDSASVFINAENIIKQLPIPIYSHVIRLIAKNFYIFLHNFLIFPLVCLFVGRGFDLDLLFVFPGLILLILNLTWISLIVGIICTRYRDFPPIIASILQVAFYVTPILWMPSLLKLGRKFFYLELNPFFQLIQLVREPLLGRCPLMMAWMMGISLLFLGWILAIAIFNRYKSRIAYWL